MEITSDAALKGPIWHDTLDKLVGTVFQTQWDVYALCVSIGMMYDCQIESDSMVPSNYELDPQYVGRGVLNKSQNKSLLELMFQSALVTTKHVDYNEEMRLELAFGSDEKLDINPITFLTRFANYGVTKLAEVIKDVEDVELLEVLMSFLNSTYESGVDNFEEVELLSDE